MSRLFNPFEEGFEGWARAFGREAPLEVEIGFGRGEFLAWRAREAPEINLVGLEVSSKACVKALKRTKDLPNVLLVKVEAGSALFYFFAEREVEKIWALFPDPWPKHPKRRLFTESKLALMANRLADRGEIVVATDWEPYRDEIVARARGLFEARVGRYDLPPTKYFQKWASIGRALYTIRLRKLRHPEVPRGLYPPRVGQEALILKGDLRKLYQRFEPRTLEWPGGVCKLIKAYLSQDGAEVLVWALASEGGFVQHFHVSAKLLRDGRILVKTQEHAHLIHTPGVRRAVRMVEEMLRES